MTKHTPGEWHIKYDFNVFGPGGRLVAGCGGHSSNVDSQRVHDENIANARLIAAAPRLLEACKRGVEALEMGYIPHTDGYLDFMKEAINQAEGTND